MDIKSKCVYIILKGGIGNQLFQYAAAIAIAKHKNCPVILSPIHSNKHSARDYRSTLYRRLPSSDSLHTDHTFTMDPFEEWTSSQFDVQAPIAINGYFQYLPPLLSTIPIICQDLIEFIQQRREDMRKKYALTNLRTAGFIHVRRGDYLQAAPDFHWIQGEEYYVPAMKLVPGLKRWLVLSDDMAWCKNQAMFSGATIVDEPDELDGLALMSLCHGGAIIANSTYSWWGAMLGASPAEATVVYPSKWCQDNKPDLFPPHWKRI